jgi:hypothetical protein
MKNSTVLGLLLSITFFTNCQQMKEKPLAPIDLKDALITIDDCGVLYKGKRLPFGKPLPEWEKALGQKCSRPELGMFDELGVGLTVVEDETIFYIFFTNLDSPEGKAGKLGFALNYESGEHVAARNMEGGKSLITPERVREINQQNAISKKDFFYPFKTYQGVVNVQGAPVKGDMDLQVINAYREQTKKVDIFTFWDRNVNSRDETLTTEGKNGEYFQITDKECDGKLYRIVLVFTDYKLEYIRVSHLSKSDMEMYEELTK